MIDSPEIEILQLMQQRRFIVEKTFTWHWNPTTYATARIHGRLSHNCPENHNCLYLREREVLGQKQLGFGRDLPSTFDCRVRVNINTCHPRLTKSELPIDPTQTSRERFHELRQAACNKWFSELLTQLIKGSVGQFLYPAVIPGRKHRIPSDLRS